MFSFQGLSVAILNSQDRKLPFHVFSRNSDKDIYSYNGSFKDEEKAREFARIFGEIRSVTVLNDIDLLKAIEG
ncbi:hypothetical protein LptCag_1503 [Leptospirillum ferriphilum]|uniref:Uncharacterized protein n=1 Tax=Leptospirillum ferriphilum TaxID=178606 RepID=A0A094W8D6_9BACT|nr:hypothetical protein [Leptospirillum ferriphilum]KGA93793.1 hypothetical protein LptCag_1503 [Leptospirillum ferriphilum]